MFGFVVNYDGIYSTIRKVEIDAAVSTEAFIHTSFAAAKNELVKYLTSRRDDYRWALKEVRTHTAKNIQVHISCIAYKSDFCQCDDCVRAASFPESHRGGAE